MVKTEFMTAVASKVGFVRVISDNIASDTEPNDTIEKRCLIVEHTNTDGTAGITNVFYLHNTDTDEARFYNTEPAAFDRNELSADAKKQQALEGYLQGKYEAYFINGVDFVNNWAEAVVYMLVTGKLEKKTVLVFQQGTDAIKDLDVV